MHRYNAFITLTYDNAHLPEHGNLLHRDFQLFFKRLRKKALSREGRLGVNHSGIAITPQPIPHAPPAEALTRLLAAPPQILYFMAGEYTESDPDNGYAGGRPHFHALIFGLDFYDRKYHATTNAGEKLYRSQALEKLWTYGFSSTADVTFNSAAYVARYVLKKLTGDGDKENYQIINPETGEIIKKHKEYCQMSRRQGIGQNWLNQYGKSDVYATGKLVVRGHQINPPRYYDRKWKKIDAYTVEDFQYARLTEAGAQKEHHTPERLAVQEQVQAAKTKRLKRNLT